MSERRAAQLIVLCTAVVSAACGHPEQRIVDQYFNALRAKDNQTLTSFAMVGLDQEVASWKITASAPETRSPATLPDLAKRVTELETELAANKKAAGAYSLENYSNIDKVRELQKAGRSIPSSLSKVAEEWGKFNDTDRDLKRQLAEAKAAVEKERRNVTLSVGQVEEVETMAGEMVQKQLDLELTIDGSARPYTMVLRKYELSGGTGPRMVARWVVQDLQPKG
ncbi:MAG TPA: hypothetical protein VLI67_06145 [Vicinamibacteria bacterium]|nr:hypothetical protein [Vicinamibacteria bacterium]